MDISRARRPKSRSGQESLRLEANLHAFPDATVLLDLEQIVLSWNPMAERLFGLSAAKAVGRRFRDFQFSPAPAELLTAIDEFTSRPHRQAVDDVPTQVAGARLRLRATLAPVSDPQGRVVGLLLTLQDRALEAALRAELEGVRTELRALGAEHEGAQGELQSSAEQLRMMNDELTSTNEQLRTRIREVEEAQRNDRKKDEFLAVLAHELRNPLAPILTALHVIGREVRWNPSVRQAQLTAERQLRHLARLLEDLLDIVRITEGKIELRRESVSLAEVGDAALETVHHLLNVGGQTLSHAFPDENLWVDGDFTRLVQVFGNLLHNAAKYTGPGGHISLRGSREGDEAVVVISDTGLGIDPELLPKVFDLFVQGDSTLARSRGGLGVGLTLVRTLVESHGGRVEAHSEGIGRGSEFVVRLPLGPPPTKHDHLDASPQSFRAPRRILVVEDHRDAREMLKVALELEGHRVRVAMDGTSGVKAALAEAPDVALIDIGLPGLNGYEVAQRIRKGLGRSVVLIALTGYGDDAARQRTAESGFDAHLVKPVDPLELARLIVSSSPSGPVP